MLLMFLSSVCLKQTSNVVCLLLRNIKDALGVVSMLDGFVILLLQVLSCFIRKQKKSLASFS